jgi:type VI protein secretion system component VasK
MRSRALAVILLLPNLAIAEVSDKMPSLFAVLGQGLLVAALLFSLSWFRWWFVVVGALVTVFLITGTIELWREAAMRDALLHEQGLRYFVALAATDLLALLATAAGAVLAWRKSRSTQSSTT